MKKYSAETIIASGSVLEGAHHNLKNGTVKTGPLIWTEELFVQAIQAGCFLKTTVKPTHPDYQALRDHRVPFALLGSKLLYSIQKLVGREDLTFVSFRSVNGIQPCATKI